MVLIPVEGGGTTRKESSSERSLGSSCRGGAAGLTGTAERRCSSSPACGCPGLPRSSGHGALGGPRRPAAPPPRSEAPQCRSLPPSPLPPSRGLAPPVPTGPRSYPAPLPPPPLSPGVPAPPSQPRPCRSPQPGSVAEERPERSAAQPGGDAATTVRACRPRPGALLRDGPREVGGWTNQRARPVKGPERSGGANQ